MTKAARPVLQFRVHPDIYAALKKASGENGTSISEEAASRLERSIFPKGRRSVFSGKLSPSGDHRLDVDRHGDLMHGRGAYTFGDRHDAVDAASRALLVERAVSLRIAVEHGVRRA
jgi:hypothetical protein